MTKRTVTMRDVAKRAGTSLATVSYVLNKPDRVGAETRQRVLDAMRELSYYPSAAARSLVRQHTNLVGLVIPHRPEMVFLDPYFAELIRGMAITADVHAYSPIIVTVEGEDHAEAVYGRIVRNHLVDGVLLTDLSSGSRYLVNALLADGVPFVVVGSGGQWKDTSVDVDNRGGAEQAITYLIALGHRRIGFINGPAALPHACQRLLGVHSALYSHGLPVECCTVVDGGFSREGGYAAMARLLEGGVPPTAVFAASDQMAVGAMQCLHERGLRIPDDLSIMSFDDTILATTTYPALTAIRQPIRQLGEVAMDLLFKKLQDLPAQSSIVLPTELVVRASTAPPRDTTGVP